MSSRKILSSLVFFFFFFLLASAASQVTYDVKNFGAQPDGKTDSTKAFLSAWDAACASNKSVIINVPVGRYLVGNAAFWGNKCKNKSITIRILGTLVAPSNYIGNSGAWLTFERVNGLTINGGTLDGQGTNLWACKASGKNCPNGATSLGIYNSNNVVISGLTSVNSQLFHLIIDYCNNTKIEKMKISAPATSPNTDGIHIMNSLGVTILASRIGTGDDCVSIGPGSSNVWVEDLFCGPGHGISIGSLGSNLKEPGVQNVTVKTTTLSGTQNGLRIKTWAKPSNGFVKGVLFQNSIMVNVRYPIIIDQNYCPHSNSCPGQASGVKINDVTYQNVHGTSALPVAVKMDCSRQFHCSGLRLQNVNLTYKNKPATALCSNVAGTTSGNVQPSGCF